MDTAFGVMADETTFKRQQALAEATNASRPSTSWHPR
jgi:hypothetical protein